jgi:hypothetical protein
MKYFIEIEIQGEGSLAEAMSHAHNVAHMGKTSLWEITGFGKCHVLETDIKPKSVQEFMSDHELRDNYADIEIQ